MFLVVTKRKQANSPESGQLTNLNSYSVALRKFWIIYMKTSQFHSNWTLYCNLNPQQTVFTFAYLQCVGQVRLCCVRLFLYENLILLKKIRFYYKIVCRIKLSNAFVISENKTSILSNTEQNINYNLPKLTQRTQSKAFYKS